MPIIRKRLQPSDVYPVGLRYNETTGEVETLIDGVWTSSLEADPRTQTLFPPRLTSDPTCDAAASVRQAFENQINGILAAIDVADSLYAIAALILGLFKFGPFAIFISLALALATYMLNAGTAAIQASLTPAAWDTFQCVLYCHFDASGRLPPGDMFNVQSDVDSEIGGVGAFILNQMLSLAGFAGVNNLAALGTATGDCSGCGCATTWCRTFDFTQGQLGWSLADDFGNTFGAWDGGWVGTDDIDTLSTPDIAHHGSYIKILFPQRVVTEIVITFDYTKGFVEVTAGVSIALHSDQFPGTILLSRSFASLTTPQSDAQLTWSGSVSIDNLRAFVFASRDITPPYVFGGIAHIKSITLRGDGENPFNTDNCE
jgi:hypothetical protein